MSKDSAGECPICPYCGVRIEFMHLPEDCTPEQRARAYRVDYGPDRRGVLDRRPWIGWLVIALTLGAAAVGGYYVFRAPTQATTVERR